MTQTLSPIGILIGTAAKKAQKKSGKTHTETAACGCAVTISWFSTQSYSYSPERCFRHPVKRES